MVQPEIQSAGRSLCWACREEVGADPLCPHCVKLQPLGRNSDYFSVLGLPRRLGIDPRVLEPVYHALSRRFHPDVYRRASPRERLIALENSAVLNQAYRALRDPFERALYLIQLEAGREARASAHHGAPPEELFEELLEVQELLNDFRLADAGMRQELRRELIARRGALVAELEGLEERLTGPLFAQWDVLESTGVGQGEGTTRALVLAEMRRILEERAYIRRVVEDITRALQADDASGVAGGAARQ
jgi:molecular chaperone HscB